jgi:hypothetical protein
MLFFCFLALLSRNRDEEKEKEEVNRGENIRAIKEETDIKQILR